MPLLNVVNRLIFQVKWIKLMKMFKKYNSFKHTVSVINISATEMDEKAHHEWWPQMI